MDQGQTQADGDGCKTSCCIFMGRPHDDEQKCRCHDKLSDQCGKHAETTWRQLTEAVGCEYARTTCRQCREARFAAGNNIQNRCTCNGSQHLSNHVAGNIFGRKTTACPQTKGYCGVEMTAGDVTDGICHGQYRQAECKRYTHQANTNRVRCIRKSCCKYRTAAAT